jgi:glycosyltransferase involved in cell wall biosynthesis
MQQAFLKRVSEAKTIVFPPPVDLTPFLAIDQGGLNRTLHVVRHSSQTEQKTPENIDDLMEGIRTSHTRCQFSFMPPAHCISDKLYVHKFRSGELPVAEFLKRGNCFWHPLPPGYSDQGPRVIVEAMAAGLPVVADNRDGAKDRVTPETGWLCDSLEDYPTIFASISGRDLVEKGKAARERARTCFDPEQWVGFIMGE